jgi:hypothetical protein
MLGLTTAVAVHLAAAAAILPVARLNMLDRSPLSQSSNPVVIVQLVHLRQLADSAQSTTSSQPRDAPQPKPVSQDQKPTAVEVAALESEAAPPSPPSHIEDDDPLYRVPFVDAVAQADARLRVGLGCEHVDLQQLPKAVLDLCQAARQHDPGRPRGPYG